MHNTTLIASIENGDRALRKILRSCQRAQVKIKNALRFNPDVDGEAEIHRLQQIEVYVLYAMNEDKSADLAIRARQMMGHFQSIDALS